MIPIHIEDPDEDIHERCCFCRNPTAYWSALQDRKPEKQVALCPHCASRANPDDLPSKATWCRRERIAYRPTLGDISRGHDKNYPPATVV
jgi:hypothetical protein